MAKKKIKPSEPELQFYVFVLGASHPTKPHTTLESALGEAHRLVEETAARTAFVCHALARVDRTSSVTPLTKNLVLTHKKK